MLESRREGEFQRGNQFVDLRGLEDVGRGKQHMVAALAVDRTRHRVAQEASVERRLLEPRMNASRRVERLLACALVDELERPEKAAPTDVADVRMLSKSGAQRALERLAHRFHPV